MMISKIELKCFQINLMLELFMCLRFKLLNLFLKIYSLGATMFFSKKLSQLLASFLLFTFFLNLHYFLHIFPTTFAKLRKFETKKT